MKVNIGILIERSVVFLVGGTIAYLPRHEQRKM